MTVGNINPETVIRTLKLENKALRYQLEEAHREVERLAGLLHLGIPDKCKNNASANMECIVRLEQRCEQLASRLVAMVRSRQLSESAEVHFLLRTQEEERLFLRDALMTLLEKCKGYTCNGTEEWRLVDRTHPGDLSALVLRITESIQGSEAKLKLEEAERVLVLEQISSFIVDIQQAIEKATWCVFNHRIDFSQTLSLQQLMSLKDQQSCINVKSPSVVGITSDSPAISSFHNQQNSNHQLEQQLRETAESFTVPLSSSSSDLRGTSAGVRIENGNLLEACDVLRACYRALGDVKLLLDNRTYLSASSVPSKGEKSNIEQLLEEFHCELQEVVRNSTKNREALARRLTAEIEAHRQTVNKYEARLKLAEKELIDFLTASSFNAQLPFNVRHSSAFSRQKQENREISNSTVVMNGCNSLWGTVDAATRAAVALPTTDSEIIKREATPEWFVSPTQPRATNVPRSGMSDIAKGKENANPPAVALVAIDSPAKPNEQRKSGPQTLFIVPSVLNGSDSNTMVDCPEIQSLLPMTPPRRRQHKYNTEIMGTDTTGSPQQPKHGRKAKVLYSPSAF